MSKIRIRVKQENINEAKVTFECKPELAFEIIGDVIKKHKDHQYNIAIDAEGMSVASGIVMLNKLQSINK